MDGGGAAEGAQCAGLYSEGVRCGSRAAGAGLVLVGAIVVMSREKR